MKRCALPALLALALLASACVSSSPSVPTTATFRHKLAPVAAISAPAFALRADRAGDAIEIGLVRSESASIAADPAGAAKPACGMPASVWLRSETGETYFAHPGGVAGCATRTATEDGIEILARFDTGLVWLDRSSTERGLFRIPQPLPAGRYTAHALLPIGELVAAVEVSSTK